MNTMSKNHKAGIGDKCFMKESMPKRNPETNFIERQKILDLVSSVEEIEQVA
uniref:Uncharacterized protein n=1 Tax=Arion vulgaris TaxID=1028688 RepID=A0A0B7AI56_9EUPU